MKVLTTTARVTLVLGMAVVALVGVGVAATSANVEPATPAVRALADCTPKTVYLPPDFKPTVICVEVEEPTPDPTTPGDDGDGGEVDPNGCHWELYPIPPGVVPERPPGASPDAVMYWEICTNDLGVEYVGPGGAVWFEPGAAPIPSPQDVAATFRVEIASRLRKPTLAADPPVGTPSVLKLPTFVAVTNWLGVQTAGGCDSTGIVCVDMTATPTLTFDPGEAGAETITCPDGGTRFNPAGPPPIEQARGACAHIFQQRTGADGRPDAWPGSVTISWAVHWEERGGGEEGDFPVIALSTELLREVNEVQTVVDG